MNSIQQNPNTACYPFGMLMPGRILSSVDYRFGFQGQEKDDEIKGVGNSINYKYRMHDPRVGRFLSVDPIALKYPFNSPFAFQENKLGLGIELEGLETHYGTYLENTGNDMTRVQARQEINKTPILAGAMIMSGAFSFSVSVFGLKSVLLWLGIETGESVLEEITNIPIIPIVPDPTDLADPLVNKTIREQFSNSASKTIRPTWQASEEFVGKMLNKEYKKEVSYIGRKEVKYGTKGSVRPEYYNSVTKHSVEVKNYNIESITGRSNLINNVVAQANYRHFNLPEGSHQSIYIDVSGQNYSQNILDNIQKGISEGIEKGVNLDVNFITQ